MTKLHDDDLIQYFQDISNNKSKGSKFFNYDNYIFAEELTGEYIADKFGVTNAAALRKLKQLVNDNFLVSKRGRVVGKPGKRLVFFPKDDLITTNISTSQRTNTPYRTFGARELLYEQYSRKTELEDNGDALFTMDLTIKNISNKDFEEIPLPKLRFDTQDIPDLFDDLVRIEVNGVAIPYSSDGLQFYKKSKLGQVDEAIRAGFSKYYSEVVYVIPLDDCLKPGDVIHIMLITRLTNVHKNLFDIEFIGLEIHEFTMKASLQIIAPKGYYLKHLKRYENKRYKKGILIRDVMSEMRNLDLEEKLGTPKATSRSINWVIERPPTGYRYFIPYMITKDRKA